MLNFELEHSNCMANEKIFLISAQQSEETGVQEEPATINQNDRCRRQIIIFTKPKREQRVRTAVSKSRGLTRWSYIWIYRVSMKRSASSLARVQIIRPTRASWKPFRSSSRCLNFNTIFVIQQVGTHSQSKNRK